MVYDLQKASLWKRITAWMFDAILVSILAAGVALLLSSAFQYDRYSDAVTDAYDRYEAKHGVEFDVLQEEYESWPEEKRQAYDAAYQDLLADEQVMRDYNMVINLTMVIASLSLLFAIAALDLVVPLFFKNGQTLGKKIFCLCVVRADGVRLNPLQLFARTILGKFTIETMIPVYILLMFFWGTLDLIGLLLLLSLVLAQVICLIVTRRNAALHDLLAGTAVADLGSQMIFDSTEELIEFKKKIHAEQVARAK